MNDEFYHKTLEVLESTNNLRIDKKYVHGFPIIVGGRNYHEYYEIGIKFSGASNREKVPVLEMDALRKRLDGVFGKKPVIKSDLQLQYDFKVDECIIAVSIKYSDNTN